MEVSNQLVNVSKLVYNLLVNRIYWGYTSLILTFDPNFLRHPSIYSTHIPVIEVHREVSVEPPIFQRL